LISTQVRAHGGEPLEARQFQGAVDKIIRQHTKTLRKDVRLAAGAEIVVAAGYSWRRRNGVPVAG
jgi:hypothetical protein